MNTSKGNCFRISKTETALHQMEGKSRQGIARPQFLMLIAVLSLMFTSFVNGQIVSNVGTSAASFLEVGVGARAFGMGEAVVAQAQDATAMYWNSAGIGRITDFQVVFAHTDWFVDTRFNYIGLVAPLPGKGAIGLNVISFGMDEHPVRIVGQESGTGEYYAAQDIAMGATLAINLTDRFSFGLNGKYIRQQIWHTMADGFAMDVGAHYITQWDGLNLGISISNFGTSFKLAGRDLINVLDPDQANYGVDNINVAYQTDAFDLPLVARMGLAYTNSFFKDKSQVTLAADFLHPSNDTESINLGMEIVLLKTLSLRAGYKSLLLTDSISGFSLGAGVRTRSYSGLSLNFDYAYVDWGVLSAVHNFSLSLNI